MSNDPDSAGRKTGRPPKRDGPKVPYDEIDKLLVHGEVVEAESGGTTTTYPSYRELARRYGCSHSGSPKKDSHQPFSGVFLRNIQPVLSLKVVSEREVRRGAPSTTP